MNLMYNKYRVSHFLEEKKKTLNKQHPTHIMSCRRNYYPNIYLHDQMSHNLRGAIHFRNMALTTLSLLDDYLKSWVINLFGQYFQRCKYAHIIVKLHSNVFLFFNHFQRRSYLSSIFLILKCKHRICGTQTELLPSALQEYGWEFVLQVSVYE